jgi:outer membrane receptor protein involved in Fe transport
MRKIMKKNHLFQHTLLSLAIAASFSAYAHAEYSEPENTETVKKVKETKKAKDGEPVELDDIVITERADSLVGIASSASVGNVGQEQLKYRPITRPSEVLETVPGLISTQHSGEGKAAQYYLRGFNLDHGTDFLTQIDGVPVNLPSHAHGQGWMDTNFLIPELIKTVSYQKGNYYAENGDFSSAGAANIQYMSDLPDHMVKFTGGMFDYYRGVVMGSQKVGDGKLLYAGEIVHNGGPWDVSNEYLKFNGVLKYSEEYGDSGWSITGMAMGSDWNSTDQIPQRAVDQGLISRWGNLDPSDGGRSDRYSVTGEWHRQDKNSKSQIMAYGLFTSLDLYSNFTFFQDDAVNGDQFGQPDKRYVTGFKATHTIFHKLGQFDSESTFGLQFRNDNIQNSLTHTAQRRVLDYTRNDTIWQSTLSPYFDNKTTWTNWFKTNVGVRLDGYRFNVSKSNQNANNGTVYDGIASPKLGMVFGPWAETEFYLNGGLGFHSNDARGVNTQVDPKTGENVDGEGNRIEKAVPLARTYGAEIGMRSNWIKGLNSTLAIWWLDIDSELVFVGDAGTTSAGRPSRRYGIESANFYSPTEWLTFDADLSFSKARFQGQGEEGNYIPGAVETVIASGVTFHDVLGGVYGGPRLRYFGPRALIEDNSVRSQETLMLSGTLGYEFNKHIKVQAEVFNILNRQDSGIDYFYSSCLKTDPCYTGNGNPVDDIHFHPVEPVSFRMSLITNF